MSFKDTTIDFSNQLQASLFIKSLRMLQGPHRVSIVRYRPRRSDRQNRMYWPAFVQPFADFLREQGETITDEQAHELLKAKFLQREVVNPATGEIIGTTTRSTTELDTAEFNEYLDRVAAWLWEYFHIAVGVPEQYHEKAEQ